jgi:hypothetical protein
MQRKISEGDRSLLCVLIFREIFEAYLEDIWEED